MIQRFVLLIIGVTLGLGLKNAAAQWVLPPGEGWLQIAVYHQDTRTQFDLNAERNPILSNGRAVTSVLYMTGAVGILRGIDVWAQVPFQRLQFDNNAGERAETGLGDPRFFVRIGPEVFGLANRPIALRIGLKLARETTVDAELIPLSEGQPDLEAMLEIGRAFSSGAYIAGWMGYRLRAENTRLARKPGNEGFFFLNSGGPLTNRFTWKLTVEGLTGGAPRIQGLAVRSARRHMVQITPTLGVQIGAGLAELGVRLPLAGRNLPAGPALFVGYFFTW